MDDLGKADRSMFEEVIAPRLGADREDVSLGPRHGIDFGVLDVDERALVVATDPISILPKIGFERAGALAIDIVLADVAVSGIAPTHLAVGLTLPPEMTDAEFATMWRGVDAHASDLGVSIITGHTARYPGVEYSWIGGATAIGVGKHHELVRPDGARPGDAIVLSTGPAAEAAGLLSALYPDALDVPSETVATAQKRLGDIYAVADANAIHDAAEATAMHDATEGGIAAGLHEMADGAGVRFEIERDAIPIRAGVKSVCRAVGVDPWRVSSAGALITTLAPTDAEAAVAALEARDTPAAVIGRVRDGIGVVADGEPIEPPATDPLWDVFAALDEA